MIADERYRAPKIEQASNHATISFYMMHSPAAWKCHLYSFQCMYNIIIIIIISSLLLSFHDHNAALDVNLIFLGYSYICSYIRWLYLVCLCSTDTLRLDLPTTASSLSSLLPTTHMLMMRYVCSLLCSPLLSYIQASMMMMMMMAVYVLPYH